MSSYGAGPLIKTRTKSRIEKGRWGYATPEHVVRVVPTTNAGVWAFVAPAPCKVVAVTETHATASGGSNTVEVRKHLAAHVAAPGSAVSGANITLVAAADANSTANTPQDADLTAANVEMETGDKLAVVAPSTYAGALVQLLIVFL